MLNPPTRRYLPHELKLVFKESQPVATIDPVVISGVNMAPEPLGTLAQQVAESQTKTPLWNTKILLLTLAGGVAMGAIIYLLHVQDQQRKQRQQGLARSRHGLYA